MTYQEHYGNFEAYQKECAEIALKHLKEGSYYSTASCKTINLFERPEYMLNEDEREEKKRLINQMRYLQTVADGEENDPIYILYWEHLKNTEFPSWRRNRDCY